MVWEGIGDLIGTIAKHWTPEQIKARARDKIEKLQEEESALLDKKSNAKTSARLLIIRRDIKRLQDYCKNH